MTESTESKDLVAIPPETAMDVYTTKDGLDPYISMIRAQIDNFVPDTTTSKGRAEIASMAHKVAKSKVYLDDTGKKLVEGLKDVPKKIDAERKRVRELLDGWKEEVRKPLTEWEAAEQNRISVHQLAIDLLMQLSNTHDLSCDELRNNLESVQATKLGEHWEEFAAKAGSVKDYALETINAAIVAREKFEADQAELQLLRAEQVERERIANEQRIAQEAVDAERVRQEQVAQAERDAVAAREEATRKEAAQREETLRLELEQAEQAREAAEQQARDAVEKERQRVLEVERVFEQEKQARERDTANKKSVNNAALQDFVSGGLSEADAKLAVTLIANKVIRAVTIAY